MDFTPTVQPRHYPTDSMVTVSLSEPDHTASHDSQSLRSPSMMDIRVSTVQKTGLSLAEELEQQENGSDLEVEAGQLSSPIHMQDPRMKTTRDSSITTQRSRSSSQDSQSSAHVDWKALDKTEEGEKDENSDKATALLLARLETENNRIVTDPKSGLPTSPRSPQPPSIGRLKRLIENDPEDIRFSQLPAPPMRELDFWLALTRDYAETAQRLPILTASKIRSGIPPPLRGEVWKAIVGARDLDLEDEYDKLRGMPSPHEDRIDKDVGRTFPDHDFFNNSSLPGQKMLWNVLKCFSLYDTKIGYCQGLGFPVGTLLLQMGEKEAFCVFVRLMENHDLTDCFAAPDLPGLQLRMYQYHRLLHRHLPELAQHLDELQVNPVGYFPKWLLSLFAATCPQPLLVRIWDVMFAEGAIETVMRVGLAIMRRNEQTLMSLSEIDQVFPILLSRKMWDSYYPNLADELVRDFVSLSANVTREILLDLEVDYKEAQTNGSIAEIAPPPEMQSAALRFLGRLWTSSSPSSKSALSPGFAAPRRSSSFFMRSSKQSYTSTALSDSSASIASTAATEASLRNLEGDVKSQTLSTGLKIVPPKKENDEDKQIEDLLLALSDAQRQNDLLQTQLQKKEEEKREDSRAVTQLIETLKTAELGSVPMALAVVQADSRASRRRTTVSGGGPPAGSPAQPALPEDILALVEKTAARFTPHARHTRNSSLYETKDTLRSSLARTKEQLQAKTSQCEAMNQQLAEQQEQTRLLNETVRETRHRLQESFSKTQQLEKTITELRSQTSRASSTETSPPPLTRSTTLDTTRSSGLRELKLGRSSSIKSVKSTVSRPDRNSSLIAPRENGGQLSSDEMLSELIAAKTSEAQAKNELAELQRKYDTLRRSASALAAGGVPTVTTTPPATTAGAAVGGFWSGWGRRAPSIPGLMVGDGNDGK